MDNYYFFFRWSIFSFTWTLYLTDVPILLWFVSFLITLRTEPLWKGESPANTWIWNHFGNFLQPFDCFLFLFFKCDLGWPNCLKWPQVASNGINTLFEKSNFCPKIQFWQNPNIFTSFSTKIFFDNFSREIKVVNS